MRYFCCVLMMLSFLIVPAQAPLPRDVVISEILFNPAAGGFDYLEGYNRSGGPVDLNQLYITNRNAAGDISGSRRLSKDSLRVSPGGYFVVTENKKWLQTKYPLTAGRMILEISSMPSFADQEGDAVFCTKDSQVIDELQYRADWHYPLISEPAGVSLERLNTEWPTQDRNNWASASSASGYGTPGYENSQRVSSLPSGEELSIPPAFTPDHNGVDDIELIRFSLREPGFIANAVIYDMSGRKVRHLIKNESVGVQAVYQWDGLDERGMPLSAGVYVVVTELFNTDGRIRKFRNAVTLLRR